MGESGTDREELKKNAERIVTEIRMNLMKWCDWKTTYDGSGITAIVGVSGGADSMALLKGCEEIYERYGGLHIVVVHVNHQIRGDEADRDASFVRDYCRGRHLEYIRKDVNVPQMARDYSISLETAGRVARYEIFREILEKREAACILVAHHADDNLETILMNFLRGSGTAGLAGMRTYDENRQILRPLLGIHKADLVRMLEYYGVGYVTDSTNEINDATRNKIRNQLIPAIREIGSTEPILRNASLFRELDDDMTNFINDQLDNEAVTYTDNGCPGFYIKNQFLEPDHPFSAYMVREILTRLYGSSNNISWKTVNLIRNMPEGGRMQLPGGYVAARDERKTGFFEDDFTKPNRAALNSENGVDLRENGWRMEIQEFEAGTEPTDYQKFVIYADADKVRSTGVPELRSWSFGDWFYNSEDGSTKLSNYFTNKKIPRELRNSVPLVAFAGTNELLWVSPDRTSQRYWVTEKTRSIMKITIYKEEQNGES